MLSLFFIPLLIDLRNQYQVLEVEKRTQQLLYEELQAKIINNDSYLSYTLFQDGIEYKVLWRDSVVAGQKEVCVQVEKNSFMPKTERCMVLE